MMELLGQVSNAQFVFPAAAVAVVLVCAALVFMFGFHSAEQPQFDKLPLVIDDKKSSNKKRKPKEKKSSPNRSSSDDAKGKSESSKKSPVKEKVKEAEKPKPKSERPVEPKTVKAPVEAKKGKKGKSVEVEKPADFDDDGWQEVPKKSQKKVKGPDEKEKDKKESPKKNKTKKVKDADVEAAQPVDDPVQETIKVVSVEGPGVDAEAARALQAQIEEVQRVLKAAEQRDNATLAGGEPAPEPEAVEPEDGVKDLRSTKKNQNKEKQVKKKANEAAAVAKSAKQEADSSDSSEKQDDKPNAPVFDELGDSWTDAKAKKGKKKARKEQ